jgi:septal ring factor EnvC (AmiA/AmiB activator)
VAQNAVPVAAATPENAPAVEPVPATKPPANKAPAKFAPAKEAPAKVASAAPKPPAPIAVPVAEAPTGPAASTRRDLDSLERREAALRDALRARAREVKKLKKSIKRQRAKIASLTSSLAKVANGKAAKNGKITKGGKAAAKRR